MPTVRIQEKNYSESIMVLKLKDGSLSGIPSAWPQKIRVGADKKHLSYYLTFRVRW